MYVKAKDTAEQARLRVMRDAKESQDKKEGERIVDAIRAAGDNVLAVSGTCLNLN